MTPTIRKVHNNSTKRIDIYTAPGSSTPEFSLNYGDTKVINAYISNTDVYSEIKIPDLDAKSYQLKYNNDFIIFLNDNLGKSSGIPDAELHIWKSTGYVDINVNYNDFILYNDNDQLGVTQPDGKIKYYYMVFATRNEGGGLTLKGFEPRGEEVVEEDNNHMKYSRAGDEGSTQNTTKTG